MGDNLQNITLPTNEWVDLYQLSSVAVGTGISVENVGSCDVYLAVQENRPDTDHDAYNIIHRNNGVRVQNNNGDAGAWAFCNSKGGKVQVMPLVSTGFYPNQTVDVKVGGGLVSPGNPLPISDYDSAHRSATNSIFGDKIVGTRIPTIAAQFQYGLSEDDTAVDIVSTGAVTIDDAMLKLNTGVAADGSAGVQSTSFLRYIPGHEAYCFFTAVFSEPQVGLTQRTGLFDFDGGNGNGFFVGYDGLDFGVCRRRDGVDTFQAVDVSEVFPNGIDPFDPTKGNVYKISFGYLGFATIHFEALLPEGSFTVISEIQYPNTSTVTHIANTNLPLRAEMTNDGNTIDSQLRIGSVSAGVVDGGGADPSSRTFTKDLGLLIVAAGTPETQLVHFRNKGTFFGITNKIVSQLILVSAATDGNKTVVWGIKRNADITTPGTWNDTDPDSVIEFSLDTVVDLSTGKDILAWNMAKVDTFFEDLEELLVTLSPGELATFFATSQVSNEVNLSIRYKDLF